VVGSVKKATLIVQRKDPYSILLTLLTIFHRILRNNFIMVNIDVSSDAHFNIQVPLAYLLSTTNSVVNECNIANTKQKPNPGLSFEI